MRLFTVANCSCHNTPQAQSERDKEFYTNKCATLDRQLDALVYELYALTPDEIKIVEGAAK